MDDLHRLRLFATIIDPMRGNAPDVKNSEMTIWETGWNLATCLEADRLFNYTLGVPSKWQFHAIQWER